jgi:hypothetical protein
MDRFRFQMYRDFSHIPAMQCSLNDFLAHWPLFWQRIQIADRPAYIAATLTGGHATHKLCQPPDSRRAEWLFLPPGQSRAGEHIDRF